MKYVGLGLLGILLIILLLLLIAIVRTLLMPKKTSDYKPEAEEKEALRLAEKLSKMVQCDTTSHAGETEVEKYLEFHKVLEELFPLVHKELQKTEIDGNLLYYWKGEIVRKADPSDESSGCRPGRGRVDSCSFFRRYCRW